MLSPNMFSSIIIIVFLMICLTILGKKIQRLDPSKPIKGPLFLVVLFIDMFNNLIQTYYGKRWRTFAPLLITIFIFLAFANTISLVGLSTPLSNINIALSFSLFALLTIQISALVVRTPWKRLKDLSSPSVLLLPVNLIGELSTSVAMGLRLFGNLLSGAVIAVLFMNLLPAVVSIVPVAFVVHPIFNIGFGLVQAFVYFMLLTIFLAMGVQSEEEMN